MLLRGNSEPKEANLHRIFGKEENVAYLDRRGAYIIPIKGEEIGVVETPKGLFLLGGGIDGDETDNQCIIRECIEEAPHPMGRPVCHSADAHQSFLGGHAGFSGSHVHRRRD